MGPLVRPPFCITVLSHRLREVTAEALPLVPRAVLLALAGRADARFTASVALGTLAQDAGTTVATVRRALADLLEARWITIVTAPTPRVAAVYQIHPLGPAPEVSERSPQTDRSDHPVGVSERSPSAITLSDRSDPSDAPPFPTATPHHALRADARRCADARPRYMSPSPSLLGSGSRDPEQPRSLDRDPKIETSGSLERGTGETSSTSYGTLPLFAALSTETPIPASVERPTKKKTSEPTDDERKVFDGYLRGRRVRGVKLGIVPVLDAKRLKLIRERLAEGYRAIDLGAAAFGVWLSDWHFEQGHARFDLALRDSEHIERFAKLTRERDEDLRRFAKTSEAPVNEPTDEEEDGPPLSPEQAAAVLEQYGMTGNANLIRKAHGLPTNEAASG